MSRETYFAVQPMYYPGFTIGAVFGEFGAMLATLALLAVTPPGIPAFWLSLAALAGLLLMHALYWLLTHPVNKVWLRDQKLRGAGAAFFAVGGAGGLGPSAGLEWTKLRNRWEYSHVTRAVFAMASLIALAAAATTRP
jgi:hypothetical protein